MHELALSADIVRTVLATPGVRTDNLRTITVKAGALSSVSVSNMAFCMDLVLEQSDIHGVEVRIEEVPARAVCECGHQYEPESLFTGCPKCGGFVRDIIGGKDVTVESVEVEDDEDQAG